MEHDLEARRRLGQAVRSARRAAGLSKTPEWAERVGRSDRMLLGLERGEAVGPDTYAAVARALNWPLDRIYAVLAGEDPDPVVGSTPLTAISDEELAAEVLRRMKERGERGGDTPATNQPGAGPDNVTQLGLPPDADLDDLPSESDDPPVIGGGRRLPDAARRSDQD